MSSSKKSQSVSLIHCYDPNSMTIEMGIDEVGRGPLFGRVYAAAVVLPKDDSFDHSQMKDSKKFHSSKKRSIVSDYIKKNALFWTIQWVDETTIDSINILQASQEAMHKSIHIYFENQEKEKPILLVDGNYFKPYAIKNKDNIEYLEHHCIEGGDNKYTSIAAASILAKVARDEYIDALCQEHPELTERYGIDSNKGYGSRQHLQGIQQFGITEWHRRTFGICKQYL